MDLGFKDLTVENFLHPDEMMRPFVSLTTTGQTRPISEQEWASEIIAVALSEDVPLELQRLFVVARSAMVYGCYFYPLFTLASEQLLRAAEAAAALRCGELNAGSRVKTLYQHIEWLREAGVLSSDDAERWHSLRRLRNSSSHPSFQMILLPGQAVGFLERIAADIGGLYARGNRATAQPPEREL